MNLQQTTKNVIQQLGEKAPEYFGVKKAVLAMQSKKGKFSQDIIQKALDYATNNVQPEAPAPLVAAPAIPASEPKIERAPPSQVVPPREEAKPPPSMGERMTATENNIGAIVNHFNTNIAPAIDALQKKCASYDAMIQQAQNVGGTARNGVVPTLGQALAVDGAGNPTSLTRPPAQTMQTFTERIGNPLDTGIAPSAAQVAEQAAAVAAGRMPGQPYLPAGPAVPPPAEAAAVGVTGWNLARPKK